MAYLEESWNPVATTLGYVDEKTMLEDFYTNQGYSISELAKVIGASPFTVRIRLQRAGIVLRGRGGPHNRTGRRRLAAVSDHDLTTKSIFDLVREHGVHPSTVTSERRFREKQREKGKEIQPV